MPVIEMAMVALAIAWPLLRLRGWHRHRVVAVVFVVAAIAAIALGLMTSALRWPLAPAVVLLLLWEIQATAIVVGDVPASPPTRVHQAVYAGFALLCVPVGFLPLVALPAATAIDGSGPHLVGTRLLALSGFADTASTGGSDTLRVRAWYPGEPEADLRPIRGGEDLRALEPALALHLAGRPWGWLVRSVTRPPVVASEPMRLLTRQREYPVVLVATPARWQSLLLRRLTVELASRGFVVVEVPAPASDRSGPAEPSTDLPRLWRVIGGLRELAATSSGDGLAGRIRTSQVGWLELHGNGSAGRMLADSGAAVALVALDPLDDSRAELGGIPELRLEREGAPTAGGSARIRTAMPGALPIDFTDLARWSPWWLRRTGLGGWIAAARMEAWIEGWTTTFLGVHLAGLPTDSLEAQSSRHPGTMVSLP